MNPDSEDFDVLRKLLALKRHEVPPPGYFEQFSSRVADRIRAGAVPRESIWSSFIHQIGFDLDLKPAFVCAFGVLVTALMTVGVITSHAGAFGKGATMASVEAGVPDSARASWSNSSPTPSSTAPVLAQSSPFSHLFTHGQRANCNVLLVGN